MKIKSVFLGGQVSYKKETQAPGIYVSDPLMMIPSWNLGRDVLWIINVNLLEFNF